MFALITTWSFQVNILPNAFVFITSAPESQVICRELSHSGSICVFLAAKKRSVCWLWMSIVYFWTLSELLLLREELYIFSFIAFVRILDSYYEKCFWMHCHEANNCFYDFQNEYMVDFEVFQIIDKMHWLIRHSLVCLFQWW